MENRKAKLGPLLIIIAACFWGSMGIFVTHLEAYGFTAIQIVAIRLTLAAVLFSIILLFIDRTGFKIALRDIPLFLGLGLGSILGTVALRRYSPYTVTTYTFVFAGSENLPLLLGFCVLTAVIVLNVRGKA